MDANDVAEIAIPSQNGAYDLMKFWELQMVGYRDETDDHRAHLA
jgi:hypothetical protein